MKLQFFATLNAVLKGGSLAAAADEMKLSPSAVSMQMKQLEEYFGQALFDRSGLQVRPTAFALELNEASQGMLETINALRRRNSPQVQGRIRVGMIESMQAQLLPGAMHNLRSKFPLLEVLPVRGRSVELIESLKAGRLDFAVVIEPDAGGSSRLEWNALLRRDLVLIAPPESRQAALSGLLKQYDLIKFDRNTNVGKMAAQFLAGQGLTPRGGIELQSIQAVVAMVSAGLGVSVVLQPDPRICIGYPVRILRLGNNAPCMRIALACRKTEVNSRLYQAVHAAFAAVASRTEATA